MHLCPALAEDAEAIAALARDAFVAAFGQLYQPRDLAAFLAAERTAERYREQIADPATRVELAEAGGRLVAYALVVLGKGFCERPEPRPARPVTLSQLYCAPEATGRGIGAALIEWALGQARGWNADAVQLSVFSENLGAQRFYRRHGFDHMADIEFWVGGQCDHEFLFELRL
jgi:GNAT superfamily N-acetyltransferase